MPDRDGQKQPSKEISQILLEQNIITPQMLQEALDYQQKYGGGVTQYLVAFGYLKEDDLAHCVSSRFNVPYLSLKTYSVPAQAISLIPARMAQEYCLVPVDCEGDILTVVMADPLDKAAIEKIQETTGYTVRPYVGVISDITEAIGQYYDVPDWAKVPGGSHDYDDYQGLERRRAGRTRTVIDIDFEIDRRLITAKTINLSAVGLLFETQGHLTIGSYVAIVLHLPQAVYPQPIAATVQIVREKELVAPQRGYGARFATIGKKELTALLEYSRKQEETRKKADPGTVTENDIWGKGD